MKMNRVALLASAVFLFAICVPTSAHHGTAVFDMSNLTTIKGTIAKFDFMNPHALIYVDVIGEHGKAETWVAEESSNNHLSRVGWDKNSLKVGEQVTIVGHRAKNGARALELQCPECSVTNSEGRVLPPG